VIRAESGSRVISVNGAAAHKAAVGDRVIICAYGSYNEAELINHKPRLVYLDEHNRIVRTANTIPVQAA
jgi:aspartate 1-decarboxylase